MDSTINRQAIGLRPGDLVDHGGRPHRISNVTRQPGWAWPIAVDGTGWAIALDQSFVAVVRGTR